MGSADSPPSGGLLHTTRGDPRPRLDLIGDSRGVAAVEFALVGMVLTMLMGGILVYGGYFLIAHSVQQLANDSARAGLAGLNATERRQLASDQLNTELPRYRFLPADQVKLHYNEQQEVMTVGVAYDGSSNPIWALNGLIPMPSPTVARDASVQLGGF